jgi:hypothetical protein
MLSPPKDCLQNIYFRCLQHKKRKEVDETLLAGLHLTFILVMHIYEGETLPEENLTE